MLRRSFKLSSKICQRHFGTNYYSVLGLDPNASLREIDAAFATKTKQYNFTIGDTGRMNSVN